MELSANLCSNDFILILKNVLPVAAVVPSLPSLCSALCDVRLIF